MNTEQRYLEGLVKVIHVLVEGSPFERRTAETLLTSYTGKSWNRSIKELRDLEFDCWYKVEDKEKKWYFRPEGKLGERLSQEDLDSVVKRVISELLSKANSLPEGDRRRDDWRLAIHALEVSRTRI